MALTATIHNFDIELSDVDRGMYASLTLRVARHPSETEEYLLTRILAYCLDYTEGIAFTARLDRRMTFGLSVSDGQIYIDIGGKTLTGTATRFRLA